MLTSFIIFVQIQDFSLQIFHQQITFTAFGFFNLDYTFLFSVNIFMLLIRFMIRYGNSALLINWSVILKPFLKLFEIFI